eukprot:Colp12_sorted_trinity150504_noHs@20196
MDPVTRQRGGSEKLQNAREAFAKKNTDLSKHVHQLKTAVPANERYHKTLSEHVKDFLYSAHDGVITSLVIIGAIAGANLSSNLILILGVANLIATGVASVFWGHISRQADNMFKAHERMREVWEMENYPEGEIKEMVEIYMAQGFNEEDAKLVLNTMYKYKDFFVDHMLVQELGFMPPKNEPNVAFTGFMTLTSFVLAGFLPLLVYFADFSLAPRTIFEIDCALTAIVLYCIGAVKSHMLKRPLVSTSLLVVASGILPALCSYALGHLCAIYLQDILHNS